MAGIEVPFHGMVYSADGSRSYFIWRFDRLPRKKKAEVEDFAQLSGNTRETKYGYSMEKVAGLVEQFCAFPMIERRKLFRLTLFPMQLIFMGLSCVYNSGPGLRHTKPP